MSRIVLIGAGHTHIELARRSAEFVAGGHEIVLVNPYRSHPYSGMGPGLLAGTYSLADVMLPAASLVEQGGGRFVADSVAGLDPERNRIELEGGATIDYDVVSFNLGSEPVADTSGDHVYPVKPINTLAVLRHAIEQRSLSAATIRVGVIGGGPGGVELAANSAHLLDALRVAEPRIDLYTSDNPLAGVSGAREAYVERRLHAAGVRIHRRCRTTPAEVDADFVLVAPGIRPPGVTKQLGLPLSEDGGILIDRYLRSTAYPNVFAVGDCATYAEGPLDRVGVYAVRMQSLLAHNLRQSTLSTGGDDGGLKPFTATHKYLAGFNLGFGRGLLYRGRWTIRGRPAFLLKDRIDRGFMRRYRDAAGG